MEPSELTRALVGLPAAAVVPAFVPRIERPVTRTLASLALALLAVAPSLDRWQGWLLVVLAVFASHAMGATRDATAGVLLRALACAVLLAGAAALAIDAGEAADGLGAAVDSPDAVVVVAGALAAIFPGGALIRYVLAPFASLVTTAEIDAAAELAHAGQYIGWLERALLYGFVVAGAPGAIALVIAAKSIARFPSFKEEKFAEYFLIGTLSSVVVAVGAAVAVRAILGLSPALA
jgi:hypothetical protein